jgi:hypothetical protein
VYPILKRHTSVSHLGNIVIHLVFNSGRCPGASRLKELSAASKWENLVCDVLDGTHNLFVAWSAARPKPEAMLDGLGTRFLESETAIKTCVVGYPFHSPLDALPILRKLMV